MEELFDGRYRQEKLLGRGAFSEVWKAFDKMTNTYVALKIYESAANPDEDGEEMLTHEFALMINCSHANLVCPKYYGKCDNKSYLILPFSEKGNINSMIGKMSEEEAWILLRDAASALTYLHAKHPPIIHQDIKPANILIGENGEYQLTDFGISTQVKATMSRVSIHDVERYTAGSLPYMAPEKFAGKKPTPAIDVWALGATVYEMLTGDLPFGNDGGLLQKKGAEVPELPEEKFFSSLISEALDSCMHESPMKRLSSKRVEEIAAFAIAHPEARGISIDNIQGESSTVTILTERVPSGNKNDDTVIIVGNGEKKHKSDFNSTVTENKQKATKETKIITGNNNANKRLWIILVAAIVVVAVVVISVLVVKNPQQESNISNYDRAVMMMKSGQSAQEGLRLLEQLVDNGEADATYLLSRLLFESKKIDDYVPDSVKQMKRNTSITPNNDRAHKLLEKAIELNPQNYYAIFEMGCDYMGGEARTDAVERDTEEALKYFKQALKYAEKANDEEYIDQIKYKKEGIESED